jgi:hypothetical protein
LIHEEDEETPRYRKRPSARLTKTSVCARYQHAWAIVLDDEAHSPVTNEVVPSTAVELNAVFVIDVVWFSRCPR